MDRKQLKAQIEPVLADVRSRCAVAERFIDKDQYQLSIATLWANLVLNPDELGFADSDLEAVYTLLSEDVAQVLGTDTELTTCFAYINSKAGERAMKQVRLNQTHKDMLLYFASMMLDPDGHRRWIAEIREQST